MTTLDANDQVTGSAVSFPAHDFQDLHADANGGVILLTRDAMGGGTLNCGQPTNLCGTPPNPPIACYDMYLVRFDGGAETWATKLTSSSAALPPYSTGPTGAQVYMIWWYAHHGRIVSDGTNRPWRIKSRPPSFLACQALPHLITGGLIADVIAVIGSTDAVMGDVDR